MNYQFPVIPGLTRNPDCTAPNGLERLAILAAAGISATLTAGYGLRPNPPYQTAAVTGKIDVRHAVQQEPA